MQAALATMGASSLHLYESERLDSVFPAFIHDHACFALFYQQLDFASWRGGPVVYNRRIKTLLYSPARFHLSFSLCYLIQLPTPTMFLLAIGIDTYESKEIKDLHGAVADARAFAAYFENQLGVPQDHITILENESATRAAILENFRNLAVDLRIQRGDPIVIYYAGHGSEAAAPLGWEAGGRNANIQLTMPYDVFCHSEGKFVDPIPDRTLGALLEAISQSKGNNIVSSIEIPLSHLCLTID